MSTSSVAEKARMFNNGQVVNSTAPKTPNARRTSVELEPGVSRVQSVKHDLEVQANHRKLESIFDRKAKQQRGDSLVKPVARNSVASMICHSSKFYLWKV